jgi:hypothetical protein
MFEATHPFAFFDYFRIPYRITRGKDIVGRLWTDGGPVFAWPVVAATGRAGRYLLDGMPIVGHVVPDRVSAQWLPDWGTGWEPAHDITRRGRHAASVWRDGDGNVFCPFDPGEVMRRSWSGRHRRSMLPRAVRPAETPLREFYQWLFGLVTEFAGEPVPFCDPGAGGEIRFARPGTATLFLDL